VVSPRSLPSAISSAIYRERKQSSYFSSCTYLFNEAMSFIKSLLSFLFSNSMVWLCAFEKIPAVGLGFWHFSGAIGTGESGS
jgi:hypothetical protein